MRCVSSGPPGRTSRGPSKESYQGDLGWFFTQWIDRKGLPDLRLGKAEVKASGSKFLVSFEVSQGKEPFVLDIPVTVYSREGRTRRVFRLSGEKERFEMTVDGAPEKARRGRGLRCGAEALR